MDTSILQAAVDDLYTLRYHFHETNSSQDLHGKKWEIIKRELQKILNHYENLELLNENSSRHQDPMVFYLLGRARNILLDYDPKAQEFLSLAVKTDPTLVDAWNELGECFWKAGDVSSAKNCFLCAIEKKRNKTSLRNLSILLRQEKSKNEEEQEKFLLDGLKLAKEAVQLDPDDGESWLILGNAFLSMSFKARDHEAFIRKAFAAYEQANKPSKKLLNVTDLYFNKAMACLFDGRFQDALQNLEESIKCDPDWDVARQKLDSVFKHLRDLMEMVEMKGKLKQRKLICLLKSISDREQGKFKLSADYTRSPLKDLQVGFNKGCYITAKVIATFPSDLGSAITCCLADEADSVCVAMLYRLSQNYTLTIGDTILIPDPKLNIVEIKFHEKVTSNVFVMIHNLEEPTKVFSFRNIRVDSPHTLLVNGHLLRPTQMARISVAFSSS